MKKLTYTILFSFMALIAFSHSFHHGGLSDLNVRMENNSFFMISVDNAPLSRVRVFNLRGIGAGNHYVKIMKRKRDGYGNVTHTKVLYDGDLYIPARKKLILTIQREFEMNMRFVNRGQYHNNQVASCGNNPVKQNGHCGHPTQSGCTKNNNCANSTNVNVSVVLNRIQFNNLLSSIQKQSFSRDKMVVAKQAVDRNKLNTNQVKEVMQQFSFDDDKVTFAKYAYSNTVDKHNFYQVNDELTFSGSKYELNNFIAKR